MKINQYYEEPIVITNKKIIIIIFTILSSVIIFGLILTLSQNPKNEIPMSNTSSEILCDDIFFPKLRSICYAYLSKDLNTCDQFKGKYKEMCAKAILSKKNINESFCIDINDTVIKNICLRKLALSKKELSLCRDEHCYYYYSTLESCNLIDVPCIKYTCLAKTTNNSDYCNHINDEPEFLTCKGLFSKNIKDCEYSSRGFSVYCIYFVSINNNWKDCLVLANSWARAKCVALSSKNIENCNKLNQTEHIEKDLCKIFFLGKELDVYYE